MNLWLLAALLLTVPTTGHADPHDSFTICRTTATEGHPWSWQNVNKKYAKELVARDFATVLKGLETDYLASPTQIDTVLRSSFSAAIADVTQNRLECCKQFAIDKHLDIATRKSVLQLFPGTPGQTIDLKDCGSNNEHAAQLDEIRYFAHAFESVGDLRQTPALESAAGSIEEIEKRFDTFLFEGFPMFPWESLANSALLAKKHIAEGPPRRQLILFHLSAGAEIQTASMADARLGGAFAIEPLGLIFYPKGSDFRTWWGISTLATFRTDKGMGVGFAIHFRKFTAGVTWHDDPAPGRSLEKNPYAFIGMDLYHFLGKNKDAYQDYRNRLLELSKTDSSVP